MASESTSPLQWPPPSLSLLSLKSSSVQSASPLLSSPISLPLCCWCNIMSLGEGMACLCAPEGLPTHCWKEKTTRAWIPLSPPLFKHPFHPHHYYNARALQDSIVSHTHQRTKRDGDNKDWGEDWVWFCVFSPHMPVLMYSSGIWDRHATGSLPRLPPFVTASSFFNTPLQNVLRYFFCCDLNFQTFPRLFVSLFF